MIDIETNNPEYQNAYAIYSTYVCAKYYLSQIREEILQTFGDKKAKNVDKLRSASNDKLNEILIRRGYTDQINYIDFIRKRTTYEQTKQIAQNRLNILINKPANRYIVELCENALQDRIRIDDFMILYDALLYHERLEDKNDPSALYDLYEKMRKRKFWI